MSNISSHILLEVFIKILFHNLVSSLISAGEKMGSFELVLGDS